MTRKSRSRYRARWMYRMIARSIPAVFSNRLLSAWISRLRRERSARAPRRLIRHANAQGMAGCSRFAFPRMPPCSQGTRSTREAELRDALEAARIPPCGLRGMGDGIHRRRRGREGLPSRLRSTKSSASSKRLLEMKTLVVTDSEDALCCVLWSAGGHGVKWPSFRSRNGLAKPLQRRCKRQFHLSLPSRCQRRW